MNMMDYMQFFMLTIRRRTINVLEPETVPTVYWVIGAIIVLIMWVAVPAYMAHERGRRMYLWIILSLLITPIIVYILLAILGDTDDKIYDEVINEDV